MNFACFMDASMLSIFSWFWSIFGRMDLLILWMHQCYGFMDAFMDALRYGFMDAFMDALMLWFWSIFMMLWHSYKQLH